MIFSLLAACGIPASNPAGTKSLASTQPAKPSQKVTPHLTTTPVRVPQTTATFKPVSNFDINMADLEGISVNFWHNWPQDHIAPLVSEFNAKNNWGIIVNASQFDSNNDLSEALLAKLPSSDPPQVAVGYIDQELAWDTKGKLVDLAPYVNDPFWGLSTEEQADYIQIFWDEALVDGKRVSLPAQASEHFLFYNQTWAEELGFSTPPQTSEEFRIQACAANQQMRTDNMVTNDFTGGWLVNTEATTVAAWIHAFRGEVTSPRSGKYYFRTSHTQEAFTFLKTLFDKNCAWVSNESYPDEDFARRRALFATGSLVDLTYIGQAFAEANSNDQWTVLPFPSPDGQPAVIVSMSSFVLLPGTPQQQMAGWLFIRWMQSAAIQAESSSLIGDFPIRTSARALMADYANFHPQWAAAYDLLPFAHRTPALASWSAVQWVVEDAGSQLFKPYFKLERLDAMLAEMDKTAAELAEK
jgi:multiple sugar transport system substrate-binding protein